MAVFTVAHILLLNEVQIQGTRETAGGLITITVIGGHQAAKVVSDHAVIRGSVFKRFDRQIETGLKLQTIFMGIHFGNDRIVVAAADHDCHIFMVLGSRAHHGRATDVDIFHCIFQ